MNHTRPSLTHHAPPPYSWTAVRAFQPSGSTSTGAAPELSRTSWVRPPSPGRCSDHQTSVPSTRTSDSPAAARTINSDVIGVGQEP